PVREGEGGQAGGGVHRGADGPQGTADGPRGSHYLRIVRHRRGKAGGIRGRRHRRHAASGGRGVTPQVQALNSTGDIVAATLTLGIVKPDAVASGKTGAIVAHLQQAGFTLRAARLVRLTRAQAAAFYAVHAGRAFYAELVDFMTSGPCLPMALEREDAVPQMRNVI